MTGALNTCKHTGAGGIINHSLPLPDINRLPDRLRAAAAEEKYAEAVSLYGTTDMSLREIAELCGVTPRGLSAHLGRYHRSLLYARYGIDPLTANRDALKVKSPKGQSVRTHLKYKEAVEACDDLAYIEYNVSQIARMFGLDGTALASQLRVHYPSVIPDRERLRQRLGLADNTHRGARKSSVDAYEDAIQMYGSTTLTIPEVAERCNVSKGGLVQYMRFYHKGIIASRAERRSSACGDTAFDRSGRPSANGRPFGPRPETVRLYAPALDLYRNTSKALRQITEETGVPYEGFRAYLNQWHRGERLLRRGVSWDGTSEPDLQSARQSHRSARDKYAPAISALRGSSLPVARVAARFGLNPDVFRQYLRAHHPELADRSGMTRLQDGRSTKNSSREKYSAAVEEYATSPRSLRSIAESHGLNYKSLAGYVRRNCPSEMQRHQQIVETSLDRDPKETNHE